MSCESERSGDPDFSGLCFQFAFGELPSVGSNF